MLYIPITQCRICRNPHLESVLHLWDQALTWVFPLPGEEVEVWPLELVKCTGEWACWLLQLGHDYDMEQLYGENYGYRSGLNASMVKHLSTIVEKAKSLVDLREGDLVIDIASNDGTMLWQYWDHGYELLGVDPTSKKFASFYLPYVDFVSDFFSEKAVRTKTQKKAKIITSISMFYDLPDPTAFVKDIQNVLDDDGIWILEQSYMPTMIDMVSYDTVCHEHLEYYSLKQIEWLVDRAGMKIIDVTLNDINGWSFQVVVSKDIYREANQSAIDALREHEETWWYSSGKVFESFRHNMEMHKKAVLDFFATAKKENKTVLWYGASTKGNVTLQYCGITRDMLPAIAEVNEYKFGRTTPGTKIPLVSEQDAKSMQPDYFFVLPWHFRASILEREKVFTAQGWHFVFPLPKLEVV